MFEANRTCAPSGENVSADEKRRTAKNCSKRGSCLVFVTDTARTLQFEAVKRTLPWTWYADPDVLRREGERIFARAWQYVGHSGQVAESGSFFASTAGQIPVVVTRARDGELRAFVNVCRHRGHVLASGEGRRETLQCPYHAWTYGLDGELRGAPRSGEEPFFERERLGLVPIAVDTWDQFIFLNPDVHAPSLGSVLGDLPGVVRENGLRLEALRFHSR